VRTEAEVLEGLTGVLGTAEEESVGTSRCPQGKLIDGKALTAGLLNTSAGSRGEAESGDGELGDLQETGVIGDSANLILVN
jgi:hypothetical protein